MQNHHLFLHFLKNRELDELYASMTIRAFAMGMIGIFVPIYLLKLDYSLGSVFFFYAVAYTFNALFIIPAAAFSANYGFKHSIFISIPFLIALYILLYTLEASHWPLSLLAAAFGINRAFFWMGYHIDFSKFSDKENRWSEVGFARVLFFGSHFLGPLVGGVFLTIFGFKALYVLVIILLCMSVTPLFLSKDTHEPVYFSVDKIFTYSRVREGLAFIGRGIETGVSLVIWPIFIFFSILGSFTALGLVSTLSLFFSVVSAALIGIFSNIKKGLALKVGALVTSFIWVLKTFVTTPLQVYVIDSFHGIVRAFVTVPLDALSYDKANRSGIVEYIIFRETFVEVGRVIVFVVMLLVADLVTGLLFGSGASLLFLLF
jgi:MFS family permease